VVQHGLLGSELLAIFAAAPERTPGKVMAKRAVREALSQALPNVTTVDDVPNDLLPPARNEGEDCPIFFDALGSSDVGVCATCMNGAHVGCMDRWSKHTAGGALCPMCRGDFYGHRAQQPNNNHNEEGYVNFRELQGNIRRQRDTSTYHRYHSSDFW